MRRNLVVCQQLGAGRLDCRNVFSGKEALTGAFMKFSAVPARARAFPLLPLLGKAH